MTDSPTPETKRKAREGVIGMLAKRQFLTRDHVEAAFAIEDGFRALTSPVSYRKMKFEDPGLLHIRPSVVDSITTRLASIVADLNDWADEMDRRKAPIGPILDLVVEGRRLRETERRYGARNGEAKRFLRRGLDIYCQTIGWPNEGIG